jgi:hypothetical protein
MAEWKKVIVSGSAAVLSQVNVATNQQITNSQATTFLTGSFTGSFKGDGSALTGIAANFPTVATTDLATSNQIFVSDGASKYITYGNLVTDLAGAGQGTSNLTTGDTGDSLALTSQITVTGVTASLFGNASTVTTNANLTGNVTSVGNATTIASGVVTSAMITDDTIVNADINTAAAIAYTKLNLASSTIHSGSFFNGITVVSGSSQISYTGLSNTPAGIVSGSTLAAGSGQGSTTLTTNGVSSGDVTATGLGTAGTPTFAGLTISTNALAVNNANGITTNNTTFPIANTTATTINLGGAATAINIGAATGTTTVNNNLSVMGTLYVQGSVTAISSSNLYVADQFILLASGSAAAVDGGIVIDRGSDVDGNIAFGFDAATDRWGYQNGLTDIGNAIVIGTNGGSAFAGYVFTETAHTATKPTTGEFVQAGAIYTNTDGTIWMYA